MTQVDKPTATQRQPLSAKRRLWLALWSLLRLLIVFPLWVLGIIIVVLGVALSPWGDGAVVLAGRTARFLYL